MSLPVVTPWETIQERLQIIFPEGMAHRNFLTRDLAASTVFAALYIGAIDGSDVWLAPKHVYRMSDEQAVTTDAAARSDFATMVMKPGGRAPGQQWYADTSREPIRDETLREGLVVVGAAIEKGDLATTSSKGRYALQPAFAALFDPVLTGDALIAAIEAWREKYLAKGALARIAIIRRGAATGGEHVNVTFPNGETRRMKPGPSSDITKAVIEDFATHFLKQPAVLFLSESGNKVVSRDDALARSIGIVIQADKNLPDTILVDLEPEHPMLVFIEVVASDGPINARRKQALEQLAREADFPLEHIAFVTAYLDRSSAQFKKTVDSLAWGSYAWFASEPKGLIELSNAKTSLR
jgi:BsuBI/PstI restriction endonuclease domain/BsuBI/PstI restriction endonuclease HTH domain